MATREIAVYDETFEAFADLSGDQYKAVDFASTGQVGLGGTGFGILQNKPVGGGAGAPAAARVRVHGISRHVVNGSGTPIAIGSPLRASSGVGIVATTGNLAYATALQASTTNGDIISVLLTGPFRIHA